MSGSESDRLFRKRRHPQIHHLPKQTDSTRLILNAKAQDTVLHFAAEGGSVEELRTRQLVAVDGRFSVN